MRRKPAEGSRRAGAPLSPTQQQTLASLQYMITTLLISVVITMGTFKYHLIDRFINPVVTRLYLKPLGLSVLKPRGLIFLALGWHAMATYLVLPVICSLCVILCAKSPLDTSNPRQKVNLPGVTGRLANAQLNLVEGLILILGAVFSALIAGVADQKILDVLIFYISVRKMYVLAYAMDKPMARAVLFMAGALSALYLFYLSMIKFY